MTHTLNHADAAVDETIVAVSSPPGRSPRGLIRLSGPGVRGVLKALLASPTGETLANLPARHLVRARLQHPPVPALLALFPGPHSYTGQDIAELQVPGNPALLDRVLHAALDAGARLAEPGEFTFRGFLAGRFDLTQAEGIAATIAATSDGQLEAAALLREGRLGAFAGEVVDALGTQLALVEAGIDFIDQEDVVPIPPGELDARLAAAAERLATLLARSRSWGALEALPWVVLVGPPSVGKSTLFNALLGRRRAVVSATPGTTRDVLAEPLTLQAARGRAVAPAVPDTQGPEASGTAGPAGGAARGWGAVEVMLVDLAGLDQPAAALDEQVQAAAQRAIRRADLIVRIADPEPAHHTVKLAWPEGVPVLAVRTKADLVPRETRAPDAVWVSARTGENLDALRQAIAERVGDRGVSVASQMLALQPRHERALRSALDSLRAARALLAPQREAASLDAAELIAGRLRDALDDLAGLGGQLTPDDVIGRVFATFCIGK